SSGTEVSCSEPTREGCPIGSRVVSVAIVIGVGRSSGPLSQPRRGAGRRRFRRGHYVGRPLYRYGPSEVISSFECPPRCVASAPRSGLTSRRLLRADPPPYPGALSIRDRPSTADSRWPTSTQEVCMKRLVGLLIALAVASVAWTDA